MTYYYYNPDGTANSSASITVSSATNEDGWWVAPPYAYDEYHLGGTKVVIGRETFSFPQYVTRDEMNAAIKMLEEARESMVMDNTYFLWEVTIVHNETKQIRFDDKVVSKPGSAKVKAVQAAGIVDDIDNYTVFMEKVGPIQEEQIKQVRVVK